MKKRGMLGFLLAMLLCLLAAVPIFADIGPKPSVVIEIRGLEGESYYATLLSETPSTGPWSADGEYYAWMGDQAAFDAFLGYQDPDGFYFLSWMQDCSEDATLRWTYYPPQRFKLLLYFPETGQFLSSREIYERYAFDSYFAATVDGDAVLAAQTVDGTIDDVIDMEQSYDFTWEMISLLCRVIITILIEVAVAWLLFGFRKREQLRVICITNVCTQIILNILLNVIHYGCGEMAFVLFYILMELLVVVIEAVIYCKFLRNMEGEKKIHPILCAVVANALSFSAGMLIAVKLPGIF